MPTVAHHELYDPLFHTPREDLYEVYRRMRDDHPIYRSECRDVWCLTRFEDVQAAARDWKTFSNANGVDLDTPPQFFGPGTILEEDPPRHDVLRKVVRPFFVPSGSRRSRPISPCTWRSSRGGWPAPAGSTWRRTSPGRCRSG